MVKLNISLNGAGAQVGDYLGVFYDDGLGGGFIEIFNGIGFPTIDVTDSGIYQVTVAPTNITIPFDIRDLRFDEVNLATIPQYFGLRKARWIGISALLIAELILAYRFFFEGNLNLWGAIAIYLTYEFSAFLVYKSHPKLQERFVTLGVEGMSILMGVLFCLFYQPLLFSIILTTYLITSCGLHSGGNSKYLISSAIFFLCFSSK